ncbi:MAG: PKD domain-containing protein [Myxococcota bacterium]
MRRAVLVLVSCLAACGDVDHLPSQSDTLGASPSDAASDGGDATDPFDASAPTDTADDADRPEDGTVATDSSVATDTAVATDSTVTTDTAVSTEPTDTVATDADDTVATDADDTVDACDPTCSEVGATSCDGNGIITCEDQAGCLVWSAPVDCGSDLCSAGACVHDCASDCSVDGATRCAGDAVETCGEDGDGCLVWGAAVACDAGEACSNGACATTCTSECDAIGVHACDGAAGVKTCADPDHDGCLTWGAPVACDAGQSCANGACVLGCSDECSVVGARRCLSNGVQTCGNSDPDSCLEWGTAVACGAGTTCSDGFCTATCSDECTTVGAKRCQGNGVETCGNTDADSCLEWSTAVACGASLTCSNGACTVTCSDECTIGQKQCSGNGVQTCGNTDADSCTEWGSAIACGQNQACQNGACVATCSDECSAGQKQCSGNGVQTCGNSDADACTEWGAAIACGANQACQSGVCVATCSDECTAGQKQCSGNGVQTCGNTDADACTEWGAAVACGAAQTCQGGICVDNGPLDVVINEVLYDETGSDTTAFVELLGLPSTSLAGYSLVGVNGSGGGDFNTIALTGSTDSQGFYVVAKTGSVAAVLDAADQTSSSADYQNGPDNIQLRKGATVIDAFGYGTFTDADVFAGEGSTFAGVSPGHSAGRDAAGHDSDDNVADFYEQLSRTPGAPNQADIVLPEAQVNCPTSGVVGVALTFDGSGSTDAAGTITTHAWTFGDSTSASGATVQHAFAAAGSYTVTLTVTDNRSQSDSATCNVSIANTTQTNPPTVTFVKPTADQNVIQGQAVPITLDATPTAGRTINKVELLVNGQVSGAADTLPPYTWSYTVPSDALPGTVIDLQGRATDSLGAVGTSVTRHLTLTNTAPTAAFSLVVTNAKEITVDASAVSDAESPASDLVVRWDWENDGAFDTAFATSKTAVHTYPTDGTYTVALEVRDPALGTTKATKVVVIDSDSDAIGTIQTTTWYGTVTVTGNVTVPAGQVLTIAPGTIVRVSEADANHDNNGDYGLDVAGKLLVNGTVDRPVLFTSVPASGPPASRDWRGIVLSGAGSSLAHVRVEYAVTGIAAGADATLADVTVADSWRGLDVSGGTTTASGLVIQRAGQVGVNVRAVGVLNATDLVIDTTVAQGFVHSSSGASSIVGCDIRHAGSHGVEVDNGNPSFSDCTVTLNAATGLYFFGGTGALTRSNVSANEEEGVRIWANGQPTLSRSNIAGNATRGAMVVENPGVHATVGYAATGTNVSATYTTPDGQDLALVDVDYLEFDDTAGVSGTLETGAGVVLQSYSNSTPLHWFTPPSGTTSVRGKVVDGSTTTTVYLDVTAVAYFVPGAKRELTVASDKVVSAKKLWLGRFPDIAPVVASASSASQLDLSGLVGTAFDSEFDTGPYFGGDTFTGAVAWEGEVWMSGPVTFTAGSLTIAPGTVVHFVRPSVPQPRYNLTLNGTARLDVQGTVAAPVELSGFGGAGSGPAIDLIDASTVSADIRHATLSDGRRGLRVGAGATLEDVSIHAMENVCASVTGAHWLGGTISDCGTGSNVEGIDVGSTGGSVLDGLTIDGAGVYGIQVYGNANDPVDTIRNCTIRNNTGAGVLVEAKNVVLSHNRIEMNAVGLELMLSPKVTVSGNDIRFNDGEGVFVHSESTTALGSISGNNIYGNAQLLTPVMDRPGLSIASNGSTGTRTSAAWTSSSGPALYAVTRYVETPSTSSASARLQTPSASDSTALVANAGSELQELTPWSTTSLVLTLTVTNAAAVATAYLDAVLTRAPAGATPPAVELVAMLTGPKLDLTGNYWGVFPDVESVMRIAVTNSVDFSGMKSTPIAGTGPQ